MFDLVALPSKTVAAIGDLVPRARAVLERLDVMLRPGGSLDRLGRLGDPDGPLSRAAPLTGRWSPTGSSTSCWPATGWSSG